MGIKILFTFSSFFFFCNCSSDAQKQTFNWSDTIFSKNAKRIADIIIPLESTTAENTEFHNKEIFDTLTLFLQKNLKLNVKITVHSGTLGTVNYNLKLTKEHAKNIKTVLINRGISGNRISAEGYGETQPLISEKEILKHPKNEQAKLESQNIRIEIIILNDQN